MQFPDFSQSYFELFDLETSFLVDLNQLRSSHQRLQARFHPDRFVNSSDREKRLSMQVASWINQAQETLSDHVKRALYLLELKVARGNDESETSSDTSFLMEQIEIREAIEACADTPECARCYEKIATDLLSSQQAMESDFVKQFDSGNYPQALQVCHKMQFIQRIQNQLSDLQFELEDY